jgi:hypothetical protein
MLTTGVTVLQPRKNVPVVVKMLKRGEPPWHWVAFASVNEADVKVCPLTPVISAPAEATVSVVQGFDRCRTPLLKVDVGAQTAPGATNVPGTSAAAAELTNASAITAVPMTMSFFIRTLLLLSR